MTEFLQTLIGNWTPPGSRSMPTSRIPDHLRAGFYTRYSTASQHDTSTERQSEDCHAYSKRMGYALVEDGIYSDEERSGGYIIKREALHALLERAQAGELDVVVIADPTRLSRDMVDLGWLWRQLARAGVALHAATRGPLAAADIALYGFLSQEQRQSITANTTWGRKRMVAQGRVPWGAFYGYRKVAGKRGEVEKDPAQAEVIERIFELRIQGLSMRVIAQTLNKDGIDGPGGGVWKIAGINNVLNQPCYAGMIVYGRSKWQTDPVTGRSIRTSKDKSEWIVAHAPHLEIVDQSVWQHAQTINKQEADECRGKKGPRKSYLLSGIMRCMHCDGNMVVGSSNPATGNRNIICTDSKAGGKCPGRSNFNLIAVERAVISALESFLSAPEIHMAYLNIISEEGNEYYKKIKHERNVVEKKIDTLRERLFKTFEEALIAGFSHKSLSMLRGNIETRLVTLEKRLDGMPSVKDGIDLEKEAFGFGTLNDALKLLHSDMVFDVRGQHGARVMAAMRALIDYVVATPMGKDRGVRVTITLRNPAPKANDRQKGASGVFEITGTGFPPTRVELWRKIGKRQFEQALSSGNCTLDDDTWDRIAHLVDERHCKALPGDLCRPRAFVDMILVSSRLTRAFAELPAEYGSSRRLSDAVRSFKTSGAWKAVYDVLASEAPRYLDGMISHTNFGGSTRPLFGRKPMTARWHRRGRPTICDRLRSRPPHPSRVMGDVSMRSPEIRP